MVERGGTPTNRIERKALRRGRGLQQVMQDQPALIMDENYARAEETRGLPPMVGTRNWARYNKSGEVFIVQYRNESDTIKRRQPKYRDIEHAIRGTGYVKEAYDRKNGEAAKKTRAVMGQVRRAARAFQQPGLTNKEIAGIAVETADALVTAGFANARDRDKKKITRDLLRAQGLDRLGRVNPSRNRLMNAHPYIDLERRLLIINETRTKYEILNNAFIRERVLERGFVEATAEYMDRVAELRPGIREPISRELPGLRDFVFNYLSPRAVHVAPYVATATAVRYLIIGHMNDADIIKLREYLGPELAEKFVGLKQFRYMNVSEAQDRLKMCAAALRDVLDFGDRNLLKENGSEAPYLPNLPFLKAA